MKSTQVPGTVFVMKVQGHVVLLQSGARSTVAFNYSFLWSPPALHILHAINLVPDIKHAILCFVRILRGSLQTIIP
jgi:hypothetical protein